MGWGIENLKTPGPMGWGIQNFKTPGSPWGGGFEIPWGIPNTTGTIQEAHFLCALGHPSKLPLLKADQNDQILVFEL